MTLDQLTEKEALELAKIVKWRDDAETQHPHKGFRSKVDDIRLTVYRSLLTKSYDFYDFEIKYRNQSTIFSESGRFAWRIYSIAEKSIRESPEKQKYVKIAREILKKGR